MQRKLISKSLRPVNFRFLSSIAAETACASSRPYDIKFGSGGRSSNSGITATVFGAYGFMGRYIVNELGLCGSTCYVPFRGCEMEVRHLKPMFDLGNLGLMPFSPRDRESIFESLKHSDVVINLIGKHYETKHLAPKVQENGTISRVNYDFETVHIKIPETIAELAKAAGVKTMIHVSALAADEHSESKWAWSKAVGEQAVRNKFNEAIIVRPATVFGAEDRFLNWIAETMSRSPYFPLLNGGENILQPVAAEDVGRALMSILEQHHHFAGKTFQLAGPAEYSYKEIAEFVSDVTTLNKSLIDVSESNAMMVGDFVQSLINPVLTPDMVKQMQEDVVLKNDPSLLTFKDLNIEPKSMDKIAFDYLHRFRKGGHFTLVEGYH